MKEVMTVVDVVTEEIHCIYPYLICTLRYSLLYCLCIMCGTELFS